jgi:hypothetical protein
MKHVTALLLLFALSAIAFGQQPSGQCLIVTSAEGHRFRNAMIAGALTGGIGLAAGATFSGGRYEYRDAFNLPASDIKTKYKGPELQKLEQRGVHVVVVNKHDKTGVEVKDARESCQSMTAPAPAVAAPTASAPAPVPALVPVSMPVSTPAPAPAPVQVKAPVVCVASTTDAQGNETCTRYAQGQK